MATLNVRVKRTSHGYSERDKSPCDGAVMVAPPTASGTPDDSPYFDADTHWRLEIYDGYRE